MMMIFGGFCPRFMIGLFYTRFFFSQAMQPNRKSKAFLVTNLTTGFISDTTMGEVTKKCRISGSS
jgi:hypothetical protein